MRLLPNFRWQFCLSVFGEVSYPWTADGHEKDVRKNLMCEIEFLCDDAFCINERQMVTERTSERIRAIWCRALKIFWRDECSCKNQRFLLSARAIFLRNGVFWLKTTATFQESMQHTTVRCSRAFRRWKETEQFGVTHANIFGRTNVNAKFNYFTPVILRLICGIVHSPWRQGQQVRRLWHMPLCDARARFWDGKFDSPHRHIGRQVVFN